MVSFCSEVATLEMSGKNINSRFNIENVALVKVVRLGCRRDMIDFCRSRCDQKADHVELIDTALARLLRQVALDRNVTLDRPHRGLALRLGLQTI